MGSIGWSIFRTTLGAFLLILVSLNAVVWLATAPWTLFRALPAASGPGLMGISQAAIIAPPAWVANAAATERRTRRFATA